MTKPLPSWSTNCAWRIPQSAEGTLSEVERDPKVIHAYLGKHASVE